MTENAPVTLGGGADQISLVERWKAGEVIGDPALVQMFINRVLKVNGRGFGLLSCYIVFVYFNPPLIGTSQLVTNMSRCLLCFLSTSS